VAWGADLPRQRQTFWSAQRIRRGQADAEGVQEQGKSNQMEQADADMKSGQTSGLMMHITFLVSKVGIDYSCQ